MDSPAIARKHSSPPWEGAPSVKDSAPRTGAHYKAHDQEIQAPATHDGRRADSCSSCALCLIIILKTGYLPAHGKESDADSQALS